MPNKDTVSVSPVNEPDSPMEVESKRAFYSKEEKPAALFSTLPYYSLLLLYAITFYSISVWHQPWLAACIIFVGLPLADMLLPEDWLNPTENQTKKLAADIFFQIPLYVTTIVDWIYFFWIVNHLSQQPFDILYWSGALYMSGTLISTNFMVAHELFHKQDALARFVGGFTMTKMLYTHFFIDHQYGHHRHVATPKDGATSKFGETIFEYLPRAIKHGYFSAWEIEKKRLLEIEECSTHWHPKNRMIWYTLSYPTFTAIVYAQFGLTGMIVSLLLAFQAVMFLEAINYIEHYGLQRKEIAPGEYEKVNITHSWNAPHRITNYILFKLQRHSDHHENGYKPYQTLATYDASPMLPNGYAFCITMSFFPNYWFDTINPYVLRYKKGEKITPEEKASAQATMNSFLTRVIIVFSTLTVLGFIFSK